MPYVRQPEELIPGRPLFYATAMTLSGVANGVLAESHEGRPTKIEGNPEHPATPGRVRCLFAGLGAAALRSRPLAGAHVTTARSASWGEFLRQPARDAGGRSRRRAAAGIRILTETVTSPTMADAVRARIQKLYPQAKWHQWEPAGRAQRARRRARWRSAQPVNTYYNLANANVDRLAGFRFPGQRARRACATRGSSRRGGACAATRPT